MRKTGDKHSLAVREGQRRDSKATAGPGWCGSVGWALACTPKATSLIPGQCTCLGAGQVPGLGVWKATNPHFSPPPSLPLSLKIYKYNLKKKTPSTGLWMKYLNADITVRKWRTLGPHGLVVISMEKSSVKHVSLAEGGLALTRNARVLKSQKL